MKKSVLLLALAALLIEGTITQGFSQKTSPLLRVKPEKALLDEVVSISVSGLSPGQTVTIKATMPDNHGAVWQSSAEFTADRNGGVDLSKQSPKSGSYTGVDSMGMFWAMSPDPAQKENRAQVHTFLAPVVTKFDLEVEGKAISSASLTRLYVASDVRATDVRDNGLVAKLYEPEKGGPRPGVLVLGGSEGGIRSAESTAALLASRGYAALAVAYFGIEDLPKRLVEIPIEYLKKAVDWMGARGTIDRNRLAVLGGSKGGELALMLAAQFPELKAVVAYVPSSVAWQGIGGAGSSWTYQGKPVPYVTYKAGSMPSSRDAAQPIRFMPLYLASLDDKEAVAKAAIPVEKINGPVLLISGKDDQLWPSSVMAEMVMARLKEHRHPYKFIHLEYESAGHAIGSTYSPTTRSTGNARMALGGQPAANARAQADSRPKVLQFLKESLQKARGK